MMSFSGMERFTVNAQRREGSWVAVVVGDNCSVLTASHTRFSNIEGAFAPILKGPVQWLKDFYLSS